MSKLVFFDLDRTLLAYNSASGWLRSEVRLGFISRYTAFRGFFLLLQYGLGISSMEKPMRKAGQMLKGAKEDDLINRTNAFWEREVKHRIRDKANHVLEQHRAQGDQIVLLTSTSIYLGRCAASHFGIQHVLANRFIVENGLFTGEMVSPLCYGEGKVYHAEQLAEQLGESLSNSVFYTDSYSDLPMLLAVGNPVAVHPDNRLFRRARKEGWPIVKWSL